MAGLGLASVGSLYERSVGRDPRPDLHHRLSGMGRDGRLEARSLWAHHRCGDEKLERVRARYAAE